jgi:hypothetical protein
VQAAENWLVKYAPVLTRLGIDCDLSEVKDAAQLAYIDSICEGRSRGKKTLSTSFSAASSIPVSTRPLRGNSAAADRNNANNTAGANGEESGGPIVVKDENESKEGGGSADINGSAIDEDSGSAKSEVGENGVAHEEGSGGGGNEVENEVEAEVEAEEDEFSMDAEGLEDKRKVKIASLKSAVESAQSITADFPELR